jgi:hypothetical protein
VVHWHVCLISLYMLRLYLKIDVRLMFYYVSLPHVDKLRKKDFQLSNLQEFRDLLILFSEPAREVEHSQFFGLFRLGSV